MTMNYRPKACRFLHASLACQFRVVEDLVAMKKVRDWMCRAIYCCYYYDLYYYHAYDFDYDYHYKNSSTTPLLLPLRLGTRPFVGATLLSFGRPRHVCVFIYEMGTVFNPYVRVFQLKAS